MDKTKPYAAAFQSDSDHLRFALQEAVGTIVSTLSKSNHTQLGEVETTSRDASEWSNMTCIIAVIYNPGVHFRCDSIVSSPFDYPGIENLEVLR